jgi:hypothetical protein
MAEYQDGTPKLLIVAIDHVVKSKDAAADGHSDESSHKALNSNIQHK